MNSEQDIFYSIALTRMTGFSQQQALHLYRETGGAQAIYEHRHDIGDVVADCSPRLMESLKDWDVALKRAAAEMEFITRHGIRALTLNDTDYPARLRECDDAPVVLYYKGSTSLNRLHLVGIVGTRRCTAYGQDITRRFVSRLRELCPDALIVSGLAYGIDICAHRESLSCGLDTIGVLAHGLDTIYPSPHRQTAADMVGHGGLLTEYMSQTEPFANNFRQRNRIIAGISDAVVVCESAFKGGALITARVAQDYGRDVFAFPGAVGAPYSEGCNRLIRDNKAGLITSADDLVESMGWQTATQQPEAVERQLFPDLTPDEQRVVAMLQQTNDLQLNMLSVKTNISIGQLTALLFSLEMKGVVRPMAGATYHLIG